jgi:hypothetical protein
MDINEQTTPAQLAGAILSHPTNSSIDIPVEVNEVLKELARFYLEETRKMAVGL